MHHQSFTFIAFILLVISIYVAAHFYIYHRMRTSLELGRTANIIIGLFFVIMIFSPFIIRVSEKMGFSILSTFFSYTGYIWMGIMAILVITLISLDIAYLVVKRIISIFEINQNLFTHTTKYIFLVSFILSLIASSIGFFEAKNVRVTNIKIKSRYLPKDKSPLKIVQLSDIHISQTLGGDFITHITSKIERLNPDIVVVTGDITDINPSRNKRIINAFSSLNPPLGKYAVTGNHEFYTGIEIAIDFYKLCGFKLLKGEVIEPSQDIIIAGVDDENGSRFSNYSDISEVELLKDIEPTKFVILLKHKPFVRNEIKDRVDIQLSGHTHRGQIFPFSLIVKQVYKYFYGLYKISDRMHLYVTSGTGYWGPPIRFLVPPEIAYIEIQTE